MNAASPGRAPLRVVHVITKLELGGAQENTLYTLGHLDPARFSGLLVAGAEGILVEEARRDAAAGRYEARFLPNLVREVRPHREFLAGGDLALLFHEEMARAKAVAPGTAAPALIAHTHSSKAGILGRLAAAANGVPIIIHSIHGYPFHPRQSPAVRRLWIRLERFAARVTTHFIAVAQADIEEGVALGLFPRERASLIRSGIEIGRFSG
ncbi:MAG TPA: glycosyltransferase, partial [Candidatus Methanoperedens sp.]|nr:glycosyltransferase [Candidatus Methanoperedens sp.]